MLYRNTDFRRRVWPWVSTPSGSTLELGPDEEGETAAAVFGDPHLVAADDEARAADAELVAWAEAVAAAEKEAAKPARRSRKAETPDTDAAETDPQ